jgi:hypothetical protein
MSLSELRALEPPVAEAFVRSHGRQISAHTTDQTAPVPRTGVA